MPMALEADLLRPLGDVSCAKAPPLPVPWLPEQSDRGFAPVARGFRGSSSTLLPCGDDTVLNYPPLVYDLLLNLHIKGNCLCNQNAQRQFGATTLVALPEIRTSMEVEELPHVVGTQAL